MPSYRQLALATTASTMPGARPGSEVSSLQRSLTPPGLAEFNFIAVDNGPQIVATTAADLWGPWAQHYAAAALVIPFQFTWDLRDFDIRAQYFASKVFTERAGAGGGLHLAVIGARDDGSDLEITFTGTANNETQTHAVVFVESAPTIAHGDDTGAVSLAEKVVTIDIEGPDGSLAPMPPFGTSVPVTFGFWAEPEEGAADFNAVRLSVTGEIQAVAQRQLTLRARADDRFRTPGLQVVFGRDANDAPAVWGISSIDESSVGESVLNLVAALGR